MNGNYQPQQWDVITEMARAIEDKRVTSPELQQICSAIAAFVVVGTFTAFLTRSIKSMMPQTRQTFRIERTTVEKVLDPLEETWHRIAPDMNIRIQAALGILKEVMGNYFLDKAVVAWDNLQLVGIAVHRTSRYQETCLHELASFTYKPGVGKLLVEEVIRIAKEEKSEIVTVHPAPGAKKFYEGLGFRKSTYYTEDPTTLVLELHLSQELIGYRTMYHATPWETWLTSVSKVGLRTQYLGGWIPGEKRVGIFLAPSEAAAVYFAEASWYADLGFRPSWKQLEERVAVCESQALLQVDVPKDAPMFPDEFYILSDGSPGAYVVLQDIPRENIHFSKKLAPSIMRAKLWDVDKSLPQIAKPVTLYHCTDEGNVGSIMKQGLYGSRFKTISFFPTLEIAEEHGLSGMAILEVTIAEGELDKCMVGEVIPDLYREFYGKEPPDDVSLRSYIHSHVNYAIPEVACTIYRIPPRRIKYVKTIKRLPQVEQPALIETEDGLRVLLEERASATLSWLDPDELLPGLDLGPGKWLWFNRLINQSGKPRLGTLLLDAVLAHCEKNHYSILNEVNAYGALSQKDLEKWYMSKGFKPVDYKKYGNKLLVWRPTK